MKPWPNLGLQWRMNVRHQRNGSLDDSRESIRFALPSVTKHRMTMAQGPAGNLHSLEAKQPFAAEASPCIVSRWHRVLHMPSGNLDSVEAKPQFAAEALPCSVSRWRKGLHLPPGNLDSVETKRPFTAKTLPCMACGGPQSLPPETYTNRNMFPGENLNS